MIIERPSSTKPALLGFLTVLIIAGGIFAFWLADNNRQRRAAAANLCGPAAMAIQIDVRDAGMQTMCVNKETLVITLPAGQRLAAQTASSDTDEIEVVSIEPNARKSALCGTASEAERIRTVGGREMLMCIDPKTRAVTIPAK